MLLVPRHCRNRRYCNSSSILKRKESGPICIVSYLERSRAVEVTNKLNEKKEYGDEVLGKELDQMDTTDRPNASEALHSVDHSPGARISNCGHYLHFECFQRYFSSLLQRHVAGQIYEGRGITDLMCGEYLCPTVFYHHIQLIVQVSKLFERFASSCEIMLCGTRGGNLCVRYLLVAT